MLNPQQFEHLKKDKKGKDKKTGGAKEKEEASKATAEEAEEAEVVPGHEDAGEDGVNEPTKTAAAGNLGELPEEKHTEAEPKTPSTSSKIRQPSMSLQTKMRSSSFRRSSLSQGPLSPNGTRSPDLPLLSPDGDSINSLYRKQAAQLDELERENKRLAKEAQENETKWKQTEEELEELREASGDVAELKSNAKKAEAQAEEFGKMKTEITSLQRQNSQLQSHSSKRHVSSPSQAHIASSPFSDLQTQLDSKSSTVESMEMEISNLRTQLDKWSKPDSTHGEQVSALEEKLDRAERAAGAAQRELLDVRKSLERASEKAVKDGSERTSTETKMRSMLRENDDNRRVADEATKRVETLEKKLVALTNMHKEADTRRQAGERQRELVEKEAADMRRRLATIENENLRLREERERARKREASGVDDDGVDELEDEERRKLEDKIRGLEGEVYDLRRGVWKEKRRELAVEGDDGPTSPNSQFDDVDLTGGPYFNRRQSLARGTSSFSNVLTSGINAFTGGGTKENEDPFNDDDFDEDAFRQAQEDEARKRLERVKEIKRGLTEWQGWRMDVVDVRIGGGGAGEIFDI